jgi:hypothetical protein
MKLPAQGRRYTPFRIKAPFFVGSSSASQRTASTPRRLNPRRLDVNLDLKSMVFLRNYNQNKGTACLPL